MKNEPRWKRTPGHNGGTCGSQHELLGTSYTVMHCGHPTALWPYYIDGPDGQMIVDNNGRGFKYLRDAKEKSESLATERGQLA